MSMHESHYLQVSRAYSAGVTKYFANAELLPHVQHSIAYQIVKIKKNFAIFNYFTDFTFLAEISTTNAPMAAQPVDTHIMVSTPIKPPVDMATTLPMEIVPAR